MLPLPALVATMFDTALAVPASDVPPTEDVVSVLTLKIALVDSVTVPLVDVSDKLPRVLIETPEPLPLSAMAPTALMLMVPVETVPILDEGEPMRVSTPAVGPPFKLTLPAALMLMKVSVPPV